MFLAHVPAGFPVWQSPTGMEQRRSFWRRGPENRGFRCPDRGFFRLSPLRRQRRLSQVWRVLYPIGLHFLAAFLVTQAGLVWIVQVMGLPPEMYIHYVMELTRDYGTSGYGTCHPFLYRGDQKQRCASGLIFPRRKIPEAMGNGSASCYGSRTGHVRESAAWNAAVLFAPSDYFETMNAMTDGKSVLLCLFWIGIVCPIAEEMIFSMADFSAFERLSQISCCVCDFRRSVRRVPWRSAAGIVCGNPWHGVCMAYGADRKPSELCAASHRSQCVVHFIFPPTGMSGWRMVTAGLCF